MISVHCVLHDYDKYTLVVAKTKQDIVYYLLIIMISYLLAVLVLHYAPKRLETIGEGVHLRLLRILTHGLDDARAEASEEVSQIPNF
jgi:hypothetical protein